MAGLTGRLTEPSRAVSELAAQVWGGEPFREVCGPEAASAPGQCYLPLPPGRPRMLVPLEGPAVEAGALVSNQRLRRLPERISRRLVAASLRTGLPQRGLASRRYAVVPSGTTHQDLVSTLQREWRPDVRAVSFTVREPGPNHKPTFVAVDDRGRPLGFGKLAVTAGAARRLAAEASALAALTERRVLGLHTPRMLADFAWQERRVLVVEPLPADAGRYRRSDRAPLPLLRAALAEGATATAADLAQTLRARVAQAGDRELADAAGGYAERLADLVGDTPVAVGRTHGDWVPWNVALGRTGLWAWDWEHSEPSGAPALDVTTWHQLVAQFKERQSIAASLATAAERGRRDLARAGLTSQETDAVVALSTLMSAARAAGLFLASGQWRDGVRDSLIRELGR